jgi:adenylate kinase
MLIALITTNDKKFQEYKRIFGRHNIRVRKIDPDFTTDQAYKLLQMNTEIYAVLIETSNLIDSDSAKPIDPFNINQNLRNATNLGSLIVVTRNDDLSSTVKSYNASISGYIDHSRQTSNGFDWDSIFVVSASNLSYTEMKNLDLKNSVRDIMLGEFICDYFHYKKIDWAIHSAEQENVLDFNFTQTVKTNKLLQMPELKDTFINNLIQYAINSGLYSKSSSNNREKIYWAPGLAPIPLVPKSDEIHQTTFFVHDLMHYVLPDLIYTGQTDATYKNVYVVARMMSEALTLVLADMYFVDILASNEIDYDFSKRKIYPLFKCLDLNHPNAFQNVLWANVCFALLGDTNAFKCLQSADVTDLEFKNALSAYVEKYSAFFKADYLWTVANYDDMAKHPEVYLNWASMIDSELFKRLDLVTLPDFTQSLKLSELNTLEGTVREVFQKMYNRINTVINNTVCEYDENIIKSKAYSRHIVGQSLIFSKWHMIANASKLGASILEYVRHTSIIDDASYALIANRYKHHIERLYDERLISKDDYMTWLNMHPLFSPHFVAYEGKNKVSGELSELAHSLFVASKVQTFIHSKRGARFMDLGLLWQSVTGSTNKLTDLMIASGVQFFDNDHKFVKVPTVSIVAIGSTPVRLDIDEEKVIQDAETLMGYAGAMTYANPNDVSATKMYSNIVSHSEFSIAHVCTINIAIFGLSLAVEAELNTQRDLVHLSRLTIARTKTQNQPPIVVLYPEALSVTEVVYESVYNTLLDLPSHNSINSSDWRESINALYPASKATIIMISGSLRNFQKLVSSIDDNGKEVEYRRLMMMINNSLFSLFPQIFKPSSSYTFKLPDYYN